MGKPVLLMRLEGPLQSWGVRARWDVRDTGPEPTKSGVIGLLGCALGCPMGDPELETLDRALRFGVRVEAPGRVMDDFQTITGFLPTAAGGYRYSGGTTPRSLDKVLADPGLEPATIVSPRSYLQDAAFLAALEETGATIGLLEQCARALQHPAWPVYLGRKACLPTRPVLDCLTDRYAGLEEALLLHPWSWLGAAMHPRETPTTSLTAYVEDPDGDAVRQDAIRTNAARQYGFRHARRLAPITPRPEGAAP